MTSRFTHPLWSHVPALVALAVFVVLVAGGNPLPSEGPTHFGLNGQPDAYGSPLGVFILLVAMSVGFILLSFWLDELWARQEVRKTFNWFSLLDEVVVGAMAGVGVAYFRVLGGPQPVFTLGTPLPEFLAFALPATAAAVYLETRRPFVPHEDMVAVEDTSLLRKELELRTRLGGRFSYSDSQSPAYFNALALATPVVLFAAAFIGAASAPVWSTVLLVALGLLFVLLYGGMRTTVTRAYVTVRFGLAGIRALHMPVSEIGRVTVRPFRPLAEFGGYGIRLGKHATGYFLRGGQGVELTPTKEGRLRLIGSDHPQRLAEVIRIAAGLPPLK